MEFIYMKFRNNNGDMKKRIGIFDDTELETESETCSANKKGKINSGNSSKNFRYSVYTANQKMSQGTNLMTRTLWTIILLSTFFVILAAGHTYNSILVLILTSAVYQEVISLKRSNEEDKHLPLFYTLRWYWFGVTLFATGKLWWIPLIVIYRDSCTLFNIVLSYHSIISYSAALLGLIAFILSLRRYTLKYQFSQFGIMILTLLLVVTQSVFMIANIYRGLMWFILPTILVICNDISAYICGKLFGKTPLFKLSPRKTMEGFIGASIITILIAIFLGNFLSKYQIFICPQNNLLEAPFSMWSNLTCEPNLVYISQPYEVPLSLQPITGKSIIYISKAQVHAIFIGIFTAFVAPFGGFFASGFKRALHIKDFGTTIPGHGGITDRFDCQVLAGVFTFLYIRAFLFKNPKSFSLDFIISAAKLLSKPDIIRLISILEAHINSFNSTYSV